MGGIVHNVGVYAVVGSENIFVSPNQTLNEDKNL